MSENTLEFRRKTHAVKVAWGGRVVTIGGMNPIVVQYRGAPWIACAEEGDLTPGTWIIARVDGTRLVLRPAALK